MKKILLLLFCLPITVFGQDNLLQNELMKEDSLKIDKKKPIDLAPKMLLSDTTNTNEEEVSKSAIMHFPYPVIFIHGLMGTGSSWDGIYLNLFNSGWTNGGELPFCLNMNDVTYIADYCNLTNDVQSFIPSNLQAADYYKIEFDCQSNGICNTSNSAYIESNQSAIIKQGYALGIAIDKVLNATGKEKVILMGHSMGGLAAREYLQNSSHWLNSTHRVAKLITSGTPHKGSDLTGVGLGSLLGYEERSEAVRDLRDYYQASMEDGAYLYANNIYETDAWIRNSFLWTYRNVDVNCNGQESDYLNVGLNDRIAPQDLDYACILADADLVVSSYSANLKNCYSYLSLLELFTCNGCSHLGLTANTNESFYRSFKALDEPDWFDLSYKIDFNYYYNGYLTYQDVNHPVSFNIDYDDYYFILNQPSTINIGVQMLPSGAKVELYNDNNYGLLSSSTANASGFVTIQANLSAGKYYLEISGDAYGNPANGSSAPWDNPYIFNVMNNSTSTLEIETTKDKKLIKITDLLGQEVLPQPNTLLFYIYEDSTVEKKVVLE